MPEQPAAGPPEQQPAGRGSGVSLEWRLVAVVVTAVLVATTVFGAVLVVLLRDYLLQQTDEQLWETARPLAREATRDLIGPGPGPDDTDAGYLPSEYVVVLHLDALDETVELPADLRGATTLPDVEPVSAAEAVNMEGTPYTVSAKDGPGRWRAVSLPLRDIATAQDVGSVTVALPLQADDTVRQVVLAATVVGAAMVAVAALAGRTAVRRSLRPLHDVEVTAAAIAAGDLARRVPATGQDTEVGRLTRALNGMLARIEDSVRARDVSQARMRRFVSDASHELRTPLASIRGFAELRRQGAVPDDEVDATFARIEGEARRLGVLVEDLLTLAKVDEQRPMSREDVDLAVLALDAGGDVRALDPTRRVRVSALDGGDVLPVHLLGDQDQLRQVLTNLVGNAVRHTPAGTPVEVAVGAVDDTAVLEVRDHGAGVPPEERTRVFDRFSRLDASRHRGTGGTGLGLSIVAAAVQAHGGHVAVLDTPGGGATFRVTLPAPS